jgi:7-cyano-7-deazaguanine synthase
MQQRLSFDSNKNFENIYVLENRGTVLDLQKKDPVALVLAGGGIDSTVCMRILSDTGEPFRALHIDFGQRSRELEWQAVQSIAQHFGGASVQLRIEEPLVRTQVEILGRNAAFIFLALMHLLPTERLIYIGIHAGTPFYDCSRHFFDLCSRLVAEQTDSRVRLVAPLLEFTKPEIVSIARKASIPLHQTYSCQNGVPYGCGTCHSCKDREALGC